MKRIIEFIRRFLSRIVLLLNLGAIFWLLLCIAAAYTDPVDVPYLALFSLSTPFAIIANLLFILAWLIFSRRKARALLSTIMLVFSYKLIAMIFGMNYFSGNDMGTGNGRLKVMNWNAHGMGIFDNPSNKKQEEKITEYLQQADADIVCLPEFPVPKTKIQTATSRRIQELNGYIDYRFQADNTLGKDIFLGTAIFSRYKIHNFKSNRLSDYIYMLQGDIRLPAGDTIRMFFVHLHTFGLSDNDKDYIEELAKTNSKIARNLDRPKTFIWKFSFAFVRRSREVKVAKSIINESPYPVVICGDFNDLPASYTYTRFTKNLEDAFVEKGKGLGRTYNRLSPTLRIDYIFYNPKALRCLGYSSRFSSLSDHNPIIANFEIIGRPQG